MAVRITCITKDNGNHYNPHEAIESLGWVNEASGDSGNSTRLQMYDWIKNEDGYAYVTNGMGAKVTVGTAENAFGTKYVRTYANSEWNDNLLALPECR